MFLENMKKYRFFLRLQKTHLNMHNHIYIYICKCDIRGIKYITFSNEHQNIHSL